MQQEAIHFVCKEEALLLGQLLDFTGTLHFKYHSVLNILPLASPACVHFIVCQHANTTCQYTLNYTIPSKQAICPTCAYSGNRTTT